MQTSEQTALHCGSSLDAEEELQDFMAQNPKKTAEEKVQLIEKVKGRYGKESVFSRCLWHVHTFKTKVFTGRAVCVMRSPISAS